MLSHPFFLGLMLGFGAAVPIGPMNIEIIRRNLKLGTRYGLFTGFGACTADVFYLLVLAAGALTILAHPKVLRIVSVIGAGILIWFAIQAFRTSAEISNNTDTQTKRTRPLVQFWGEGFVMTLFSPYGILFWSSVSAQLAVLAKNGFHAPILAAIGVLVATLSWILGLNFALHHTRHRLPTKLIKLLNILGGILLLLFAAFSLLHGLALIAF